MLHHLLTSSSSPAPCSASCFLPSGRPTAHLSLFPPSLKLRERVNLRLVLRYRDLFSPPRPLLTSLLASSSHHQQPVVPAGPVQSRLPLLVICSRQLWVTLVVSAAGNRTVDTLTFESGASAGVLSSVCCWSCWQNFYYISDLILIWNWWCIHNLSNNISHSNESEHSAAKLDYISAVKP